MIDVECHTKDSLTKGAAALAYPTQSAAGPDVRGYVNTIRLIVRFRAVQEKTKSEIITTSHDPADRTRSGIAIEHSRCPFPNCRRWQSTAQQSRREMVRVASRGTRRTNVRNGPSLEVRRCQLSG